MLSKLLLALCLLAAFGCSQKESSTIYFVARNSPGANIHSIDVKTKQLVRHTHNSGSRDIDFTADKNGNIFFTSNRVLPEDRAERAKLGKRSNRRQDLNIFKLEQGKLEDKTTLLAQAISKTDLPETLVKVSSDQKYLSFVRTALPEKKEDEYRDLASDAFDELYVLDIKNNKEKKIHSADVIIKPSWASQQNKLVFSTYNYEQNIAQLYIYDAKTGNTEKLLENPWESNQIDAPQWSPDEKYISLILHPRNKDRLRALYLFDLEAKSLQKISQELHSVEDPVSWSSDSKAIAYSALIDDGNLKVLNLWKDSMVESPIFVVDLAGNSHQVTQETGALYTTPTFSPNNNFLAVKKLDDLRDRKAELQILNLNGELQETLHDNVFKHSPIIWR